MASSRFTLPLILAGGLLAAQVATQLPLVSIEVSPNPVQLDGTLTVTATAATDGIGVQTTPTGADCGATLRGNRPGSGIAFCFPISLCGPGFRLINRCESSSTQLTVCSSAISPGLNYVRYQYKDPAGSFVTEWIPYEVAGSGNPTLSAASSPQVGGSTTLNLSSPGAGGQVYLVLGSFSTNTGFMYAGKFMSLDPDGLLFATLAIPNTFPTNSFGVLDPQGASPPMLLSLPIIPELSCLPLHFQAMVGLGQPSLSPSTVLNFTIQP